MAVATKSNVLSIEDVNKTLEDTLESVFESERFHDLLKAMSKNKAYSLNNTLLIVAQRPQATMVMGYKEWQKLGRFVNKGEKGLKILAPVVGKEKEKQIDPDTKKPKKDNQGNDVIEEKKVIRGFRTVSVFDVSQTDGKEIPSVRDFISREMQDDTYMSQLYKDYKSFLVDTKGVDIQEAETEKGVGGYFDRNNDNIVISSNETENDTEKFRILIHEYGHKLLHHKDSDMKDLPRGHKEAQAESVAYVVQNYYGFDSADVSAGYIATWSQDMKLAKQALTEVQKVSNEIIDDIDRLQKEKIQSFYQDQSKEYEDAKEYLLKKVNLDEKVFEPNQSKETQLQLFNKENGFVMSGKLEYNPKNENFFLRTNRNLIEPLSELARDGKLTVLNVEKELDKTKHISEYSRIPDHYQVKKVRNGPYLVQSASGENVISKGFEKRDEAQNFLLRSSMSQALHQTTTFKKELNTKDLNTEFVQVKNEVETQVNTAVSEYLSHHSKRSIALSGQSGISVGWALLKNPKIKTMDELENFASKNKHVPSYTKLPDAINEMNDKSQEKKKDQSQELERTIER